MLQTRSGIDAINKCNFILSLGCSEVSRQRNAETRSWLLGWLQLNGKFRVLIIFAWLIYSKARVEQAEPCCIGVNWLYPMLVVSIFWTKCSQCPPQPTHLIPIRRRQISRDTPVKFRKNKMGLVRQNWILKNKIRANVPMVPQSYPLELIWHWSHLHFPLPNNHRLPHSQKSIHLRLKCVHSVALHSSCS